MVRPLAAFALVAALLLVAAAPSPPPQTWLVLSDIHFDPFTQSKLVERLADAPPQRWREVFSSGETVGPSTAGNDTNFTLLESTLDAAKTAAPDPAVVIIDGDFLAHGFRALFDRTAKTRGNAAYRTFVDKTIAFLAWEIETAFPRARLVPVIGNNDSYCGDYASTPHDAFLAHMAAAWAQATGIEPAQNFIDQFSTGGYYVEPLPIPNAKAIVLNDVFWSARYRNACGVASDDPAAAEWTWLQGVEKTLTPQTPVWVIAHIPAGIDVYSTLHVSKASPLPVPLAVPFLTPQGENDLVGGIDAAHAVMAIGGHTHADGFRIIGPDPSTPQTPMLVVPSVSPIFGNAPGFTLLTVDATTAVVDDKQLFELGKEHDRWFWYRAYDFDSIYGRGAIDAEHLWHAQQAIFSDERVRRHFDDGADWRAYWCGNIALTPTQYVACAMPSVERDDQTHPSPPPAPTPSPTPSPSPSASPTPTASP